MCGRFAFFSPREAVLQAFPVSLTELPEPRYNIAPTQPILTVAAAPTREPGSNRPDREAHLARWGLLPSWVKDPKNFTLLINARGESVIDKPAFGAAMKYRRCLIPADGFYEWKGDVPGRKEPTTGEINFKNVFRHLFDKGYKGIVGMEHGISQPGAAGEQRLIQAYREVDDF